MQTADRQEIEEAKKAAIEVLHNARSSPKYVKDVTFFRIRVMLLLTE